MTFRTLILTLPLTLGLSGAALAHEGEHADMASPSFELPAACKAATGSQGEMMKGMQGQSSPRMSGQMTDAQKGLHQAMMSMDGPMIEGMMAKDADVAWICAMIPHHQGAIAMAQIGLKNGDNPEAKKIAEKTIQEQEKSIKELTTWLDGNAKTESAR